MTSFPEGKSLTKSEGIKDNLAFREKALRREVNSEGLLLKTWNLFKSFELLKEPIHFANF